VPALPVVPQVIRIDHHFSIGEDLAAKCRLFDRYTGAAPTNSDLITLANTYMTAFTGSGVAGDMTPDRILTGITITDLTSATAAVGESTIAAIPGTNGGAKLPADVAAVWSRTIARRYRGGHSRVYWPLGSETDLQDAQTWKVASTTAWATNLLTWQTDLNAAIWGGGGSFVPVAVSFYSGFTVHTGVTGRARNVSTPRAVALVDTVTGDIMRTGLGSQRKRLLRLA